MYLITLLIAQSRVFGFLMLICHFYIPSFPRYEYAPLKIPLFVDKDSKSKEITPLPAPKIIKIACGPNHTIAVDDNCKAYSWGFGGYGRLGHAETSDELVPRLIKYLDQKNRGVR